MMKNRFALNLEKTGVFTVLLCTLTLTMLSCSGCSGSSPELSSSNEELEAFLEKHPGGLTEEVSIDGQE